MGERKRAGGEGDGGREGGDGSREEDGGRQGLDGGRDGGRQGGDGSREGVLSSYRAPNESQHTDCSRLQSARVTYLNLKPPRVKFHLAEEAISCAKVVIRLC